jgi:hypothetical protein
MSSPGVFQPLLCEPLVLPRLKPHLFFTLTRNRTLTPSFACSTRHWIWRRRRRRILLRWADASVDLRSIQIHKAFSGLVRGGEFDSLYVTNMMSTSLVHHHDIRGADFVTPLVLECITERQTRLDMLWNVRHPPAYTLHA